MAQRQPKRTKISRKDAKKRSDFEHESLGKKLTDLCKGFSDLVINLTRARPCDLKRADSYQPDSSFLFSLQCHPRESFSFRKILLGFTFAPLRLCVRFFCFGCGFAALRLCVFA